MIFKMIFKMISLQKKMKFKSKAILGNRVIIGATSNISSPNEKNSVVIGDDTSLHCSIALGAGATLTIGKYTTVRYKTEIEAATSVIIGDYVIISNNVIITDNDSHPVSPEDRIKLSLSGEYSDLWNWRYANKAPVKIEDNVWIGRRAMILKGVTIGKGSIVAAGAIVTKNVPPYSLCYGNPASIKPLKKIENVL